MNVDQLAADTGLDVSAVVESLVENRFCAELTDELAAGFNGLVPREPSAV
ncbi:hypothetical protein [Herbihabitans rhizosphaerae]|nr:hypothetical protein [Herbihabitans rhizosphaerae]